MRAVRADSPSTAGTVTRCGPRLTQILTARCALSSEPAVGSCAITWSAGMNGSWRRPSMRTARPCREAWTPASRTVRPTSDGTATSREESTTRMVTAALNVKVARSPAASRALRPMKLSFCAVPKRDAARSAEP